MNNVYKKFKQRLKKNILNIFILIISIFLIHSFLPLRKIIFSNIWFSKTLIIFTNETELRPCGGFFTAIGKSNNFPFGLEFNNIYVLENLKKNTVPEKLKSITDTYNFWDTGINPDINICNTSVKNFYNEFSKQSIDRVVFINFYALEKIIDIFSSININDQTISSTNVFRFLSETAANIDRHNTKSLENRKNILKPLFKQIIKNVIQNPFKWNKISNTINQLILDGDIFIPHFSKDITIKKEDFGLIEWNLGGAKSSRFLQKDLDIFLREVKPNEWQLQLDIQLLNTLGTSQPFGQTWKGGIEILIPEFIGQNIWIPDLEIKNGERFKKEFIFNFKKENLKDISVFSSRGQNLNFSGIISVFPQQEIFESNGFVIDFITKFEKNIRNGSFNFYWNVLSDTQKPFLTFHTLRYFKSLSEPLQQKFLSTDFLVEIHTNEIVKEKNLLVELQDLQTNTVLENRGLRKYEKISDNAYLLAFNKKTDQLGESFNLKITGITDLFNNSLEDKNHTIIERKNLKND